MARIVSLFLGGVCIFLLIGCSSYPIQKDDDSSDVNSAIKETVNASSDKTVDDNMNNYKQPSPEMGSKSGLSTEQATSMNQSNINSGQPLSERREPNSEIAIDRQMQSNSGESMGAPQQNMPVKGSNEMPNDGYQNMPAPGTVQNTNMVPNDGTVQQEHEDIDRLNQS